MLKDMVATKFGNWAHQLGDGRAITLGEVKLDNQVLELQLKGLGLHHIPDLLMEKQYYVHQLEFLCSEAMHHLGVPTTRALSLDHW